MRETLAFTVCVYRRCNGGWRAAAERRKNKPKENWKKKLTGLCVCTFTLKGDDLLLQDMS